MNISKVPFDNIFRGGKVAVKSARVIKISFVILCSFFVQINLHADHILYVNSLTLDENPDGSGMYDINYTFTVTFATVKRFYWELFVVESGCNATDGFTRSFTGCTLLGDLSDGDHSGVLASGILLCPGKTYDAILYTRRRGDCYSDNTGGSGGSNPASCGDGCGDMSCGCPEDRGGAHQALGLLTKYPGIDSGDPANIWAGQPIDALGDMAADYDGNWAYVRTTLTGSGVPDYNIAIDIDIDDCFGSFDRSFSADQSDGQTVDENFGGATAFVRCGSYAEITYNADNSCGVNYPGNTFEVIDNSAGAIFDLGSAAITDQTGPGVNVDGRFESLVDAKARGYICENGRLSLSMINSKCSAENGTTVNVDYDIQVVYPTSNFAQPTRVNCSDACAQDLILRSGDQWVISGLNTGGATTLPITNDDGLYSFTWSGQICQNTTAASDCDEGTGSVMVDNCASCGVYDIEYVIANDSCATCSTTTTKQVEIVSPRIVMVMGDEEDCGPITPTLSFQVVECVPATGAASATPYSGPGQKLWERSDNPGVYYPEGSSALNVAVGTSITFIPHFRTAGCESCNAVGEDVVVTSLGDLEVTCPVDLDLGTYDCSNLSTIPDHPTTIAEVEASPYSVIVGNDPCGNLTITSVDDMSPDACTTTNQTITRTITITDSYDNRNMVCEFTYVIEPNFTSPTLVSMPGDITIECNITPTPTTLSYTNNQTADCASSGTVTSTLTAHPGTCGGSITETWVIPSLGNCSRGDITSSRTITVNPTPAPSITCPSNIQLTGCSASDAPAPDITTVTSSTTCGSVVVTHVSDTPSGTGCASDPLIISRVYRSTNDCGAFTECTQLITIIDDEDPVITAASDQTVNCTENVQTLFANWISNHGGATATDNCATIVWTTNPSVPSLNTNYVSGPTIVTFIASDGCGNSVSSQAQFNVRCIDVDKPAPSNADNDGNGGNSLNDVLTYTITMTNNGNVTLTNVVVSDPLLTTSPMNCPSVLPGETCILTGTYMIGITDVANSNIPNEATANADDIGEVMDDHIENISPPGLQFKKLAPVLSGDNDNSGDMSSGDELTYTLLAINTGMINLTDVKITDVDLMPSMETCPIVMPGDTCKLIGTYTISDTDISNEEKVNMATAESDQLPTADASHTQMLPIPEVSLNKMVPTLSGGNDNDASGDISEGDQIQYIIEATNSGTAVLTNVIVTDARLDVPSMTCDSLPPGMKCTLVGLYTVTDVDVAAGMISNTANVTSVQAEPDMDNTTIAVPMPMMSFVKSSAVLQSDADGSGDISEGDVLEYKLKVTNTGTAVLTDVLITDDTIDPPTKLCSTVAVGDSCVLIGTYVVQASDLGEDVINMATAVSDQTDTLRANASVTIAAPSIEIVKNAPILLTDTDGSMDISVGDILQYTINATNNGVIPSGSALTNVIITDPLITPDSANCPLLMPGQICTLQGEYEVTSADLANGSILNTGTVMNDQTPDMTDMATVALKQPMLNINKSVASLSTDADMSGDISAGDSIQYTITATNTGTANLTNVVVSDPLLSPNSTTCALISTGQSCELIGTYLVTQADVDAGTFMNTASADSDQTGPVTDSKTLTIVPPLYSIEKQDPVITTDLNMDGLIDANDVLTYTIVVTNDGLVNLTDVIISDPLLSNDMTTTCALVAPGNTCELTGTYTATQIDVNAGIIKNKATAMSDQLPVIEDSVSTMIVSDPSIQLTKTAGVITDTNMDGIIGAGDKYTYTFEVLNTGNVTVSNITIVDDLVGTVTGSIASLDPMMSASLTAEYTLSQIDVNLGKVVNSAEATGKDPQNMDVSDISDDGDELVDTDEDVDTDPTNDPTVTLITQDADLGIEKQQPTLVDVDGSGDISENDTLIYTIIASNDGNVTLNAVTITDNLITPNMISCGTLEPMEVCSLVGKYVVTRNDIDNLGIMNTATGTSDKTPDEMDMVEVSLQPTSMAVEKSAPIRSIDADMSGDNSVGDELTYTLTAYNTGVANLTNVMISDPLTGGAITCPIITSGDSCVLVTTYVIQQSDVDKGEVANEATFDADQVDMVTDTDTTSLPNPMISITKQSPILTGDTDMSGDISAGDTLTYDLIVTTNSGTANLTDVIISDPILTPGSADCTIILPSEQCSLIGYYIVTQGDIDNGMIMNTAKVDSDQTDPDSTSNTVTLSQPMISLVKSPGVLTGDVDGDGDINAGDTLTYTITATNNGTANLTDVVISDPLITPTSVSYALIPAGESRQLVGVYVVQASDIGMAINNTANVDADQVDPVESSSSVSVPMPSMVLDKAPPVLLASGDNDNSGDITVGDIITYTITATNNGNATLTDLIIEDPQITPDADTCSMVLIGQTCVLTGTYMVDQMDIDNGIINNTATAKSDQTAPIMSSSSVSPPKPGLNLIKGTPVLTGDKDNSGDISVGDTLTYTITAENTGTSTLTNVVITDPLIDPSTVTHNSIAAGGSETLVGIYIVQAADVTNTSIENEAFVDSDQTEKDSASTSISVPQPSYILTKNNPILQSDINGNGLIDAGDVIQYSIDLLNNGTATLTDVLVSDPLLIPSSNTCPTLITGQRCMLLGSYTVPQDSVNAGSITNQATGSSTQLPDEMAEVVTPILAQGMVRIVKLSDDPSDTNGDGLIGAGDSIKYNFTVINEGNVTLTNIIVNDPLLGGSVGIIPSLDPGELDNSICDWYTLSQTDVDMGGVLNSATATGKDPNNEDVMDTSDDGNELEDTDNDTNDDPTDDPTYTPIDPTPSTLTQKLAPVNNDIDGSQDVSAGDILTYTVYTINTGNITLNNVSVRDVILDPNVMTCPSVAPGDTCTLIGTYTVTESNVSAGMIENIGIGDSDMTDPDPDTEVTPLNTPSMTLDKSPPTYIDNDMSGDRSLGDELIYTITATNNGDAGLTDVQIVDSLITPISAMTSLLEPDSTLVLVGSYFIMQDDVDNGFVENTALGTSKQAPDVEDMVNIALPKPNSKLSKSPPVLSMDVDGSDDFSAGDEISYSITFTNTGTANLTGVMISDNKISPASRSCPTLLPTQSCVLTGTYTILPSDIIEGSITNIASGTSIQGDPVMDTLISEMPQPSLVLNKLTPDLAGDNDNSKDISPGDSLLYTIVATNSGTARLTGVSISDPKIVIISDNCSILERGESCTLLGYYIVTPADMGGTISNTAIADADQIDPVQDSSMIDVTDASIAIVKGSAVLLPENDIDGSGDISAGDILSYTITATNNADVGGGNLSDVIVKDALLTPDSMYCELLEPLEQCILTGTYKVLPTDVETGFIMNEAVVTTTRLPDPVTDMDIVLLPQPRMDLEKRAPVLLLDNDRSNDFSVGDVIEYTIVAKNTGTANLTNIVISDNLIDPLDKKCALVEVGDSCVHVGTYTISEQDLVNGTINNSVTASSDQSEPQEDEVEIILAEPSFDIDKSVPKVVVDGDASMDLSANDLVEYTVTVTNTGTANLSNVVIDDPTMNPNLKVCDLVEPNDSCVLTGIQVVIQEDIENGVLTNIATVSSNQLDPEEEQEDTPLPSPMIDIQKSDPVLLDVDNSGNISEGDKWTYTVLATNIGTANLTQVTVTDELLVPNSRTCSFVAKNGGTCELVGTYTLTLEDVNSGSLQNIAGVTSLQSPPDGDTLITVIPEDPKLELVKTAQPLTDNNGNGTIGAGDTIFYNFLITNTGNVTVSFLGVTDPKISGLAGATAVLDPGDTNNSFTGYYVIQQTDVDAGGVENSAVARGESPQGTPVEDTSDDGDETMDTDRDDDLDPGNDPTFVRIVPDPRIGLSKQLVGTEVMENGDMALTFQIIYANTGNTILGPVELIDELSFLPDANPIDQSITIVVNNINAQWITTTNPIVTKVSTLKHDDDHTHPTTGAAHAGYDGINETQLFHDDNSIINPGESFEILLTVEVTPDVIIDKFPDEIAMNQAEGFGKPITSDGEKFIDPETNVAVLNPTDLSDDGGNPLTDNEEGGFNDPTPILLPRIELTKEIYDIVASDDLGSFDVTFSFKLENTGMTILSDICLTDDFMDAFGESFVGVPFPPSLLSSIAPTPIDPILQPLYPETPMNPTINEAFNGSTDVEITDCTSGVVEIGRVITILATATLLPGLEDKVNTADVLATGEIRNGQTTTAASASSTDFGECGTLSCPEYINVTIDPLTCSFSFTREILGPQYDGLFLGFSLYSEDGTEYFKNELTDLQAGETFQYQVYDLCSGSFCWGYINLEHKAIPDPIQIDTASIMCGGILVEEDLLSLELAESIIEEGCYPEIDVLRITVDTLTQDASCATLLSYREVSGKITLDDKLIDAVLFYQYLEVTPITKNMINGPVGSGLSGFVADSVLQLTCYDDTSPEGIAEKYGIPSAYPYVLKDSLVREVIMERKIEILDTVEKKLLVNDLWVVFDVIEKRDSVYNDTLIVKTPQYLAITDPSICNWSVKRTDNYFAGCLGDSSKIERTWNLLDWCFGSTAEFVQWITITDEPGPWLTDYLNYTVPISPWSCAAKLELPDIIAKEGCSATTVQWKSSAGSISGGEISGMLVEDSPIEVIGIATTTCGIEQRDTFIVHVIDASPPVIVAQDELNVTVNSVPDETGEGAISKVAVKVESIDLGSHDANCSEVTACILRKEDYEAGPVILSTGDTLYIDGELAYKAVNTCYYSIYEESIKDAKTGDEIEVIEHPYVTCGSEVKYCCEDLGLENSVTLIVTDGAGLENIGWTKINLEEKPDIQCINRRFVLDCDDDYSVEALGSIPIRSTSCFPLDIMHEDIDDVDACGNGSITRVWTINGEVVCEDHIIFESVSKFDPYSIKWPRHYNSQEVDGVIRECVLVEKEEEEEVDDHYAENIGIEKDEYIIHERYASIPMLESFTCSVGEPEFTPSWCDTTCILIGMNYEDVTVPSSESCVKIIRRWTIIDWCTYEENGNNVDDENDSYPDSFIAVDDTWLNNTECKDCEHRKGLSEDLYLRYEYVDRDGYYTYDQILKIEDDTDPVISVAEVSIVEIYDGAITKEDTFENCVDEGIVMASAVDSCGGIVTSNHLRWWIEIRDSASNQLLKTHADEGESVEIGTELGSPGDVHIISWNVNDGCGNNSLLKSHVRFIDAKKPTPVCIRNITTTTMNTDGSVSIWAKDYDLGSYDNCSDVEVFFKDESGDISPQLVFDCDTWNTFNGQSSIEEIQLWARDASGNEDFCTVTLRIQDNNDVCPDNSGAAAMISGQVRTEYEEMIEEAQVSIKNSDKSMMTLNDGIYAFPQSLMNRNYKIASLKDGDYLNGVSSLDLVKMQLHILGEELLDSPYKIIAADVNNDQRVTVLDVVHLRRMLLGIDQKFEENTSWRFVDAKQTFSNILSPWPFTEELIIENLSYDRYDDDFIGVKIGDVSGNAIANSLKTQRETKSKTVELKVQDELLKKGDVRSIEVNLSEKKDMLAYQMTLSHPGLKIVDIHSNNETAVEYGRIDNETTTLVWTTAIPIQVTERLLTIQVEAIEDIGLKSSLRLNSEITDARLYGVDEKPQALKLVWKDQEKLLLNALDQNSPNPFRDETTIFFTLEEGGETTLEIYDIAGKSIFKHGDYYSAGNHKVDIAKKDLDFNSGVLYYQLTVGDYSAKRKMIRID